VQIPPEKEKEWKINELHKWNQGLIDINLLYLTKKKIVVKNYFYKILKS